MIAQDGRSGQREPVTTQARLTTFG